VGSSPSSRTFSPTQERSEISFREYLKDKQLKPSTIKTKINVLTTLKRRCNLWDSNQVTETIKKANWINRRKNIAFYAYRDWCRWKGYDFEFEKLRESSSPLPYIPSEKEIDQLIASCNPYYASFLQTMKETAFRPGEVLILRVMDVDFERGIITLNKPLKWSNPRQKKISDKLLAMIKRTVGEKNSDERIWQYSYNSMHRTFYSKKKQLAEKLENPNFNIISFKTFRHWKATMTYHETKDILYVKELLGHKELKNTLIYTHLVDFGGEDSYSVKVASNLEEFTNLLENGFEYVSDYEDKKILRKRK
jgi:integrase